MSGHAASPATSQPAANPSILLAAGKTVHTSKKNTIRSHMGKTTNKRVCGADQLYHITSHDSCCRCASQGAWKDGLWLQQVRDTLHKVRGKMDYSLTGNCQADLSPGLVSSEALLLWVLLMPSICSCLHIPAGRLTPLCKQSCLKHLLKLILCKASQQYVSHVVVAIEPPETMQAQLDCCPV